jgi:aspartyl-tRNA synthetase
MVQKRRDLEALFFVDLRDRSGLIQLILMKKMYRQKDLKG